MYVFLGERNTLPVIINVDLAEAQEKALLVVLKVHRETIG